MHPSDKRLLQVLYRIFHPIYRYSSLEIICNKTRVTEEQQPKKILPSLPLWLIGIYLVTFGVAYQRYENRVDMIENRVNTIGPQLTSPDPMTKGVAFRRIQVIQQMECPYKPNIKNPITIYHSFLKKNTYEGVVDLMKETVENWKGTLKSVDLSMMNLPDANLEGAYLEGANLSDADLSRASLFGANLEFAKLPDADLQEANLKEANLRYTDLQRADLQGADLEGAYLGGAYLLGVKHLTLEQIAKVETLYKAILDPELEEKIKAQYPHLLEAPKPKE